MRRTIIIRNKFARDTGPKFHYGQRVWYTTSSGAEYPGLVASVGMSNGDVVYDVKLDYPGAKSRMLWGYEDQFRARDRAGDVVGSREEQAYGLGFHSQRGEGNPFTDPTERAAYERGRQARKMKSKLSSNYFKGEVRNKRFERPAVRGDAQIPDNRDARKTARGSNDFKSEQGYVAKVYSSTGGVVAESPAFLAEEPAKRWLMERVEKAAKQGFRVTGKVFPGYFDPALVRT